MSWLYASPGRLIRYGPERASSACPFQLSRTRPSLTNPSTAAWTAGIAPRQSCASARATSLGHIVADGARRASRESAMALGSVMQTASASHANRSSGDPGSLHRSDRGRDAIGKCLRPSGMSVRYQNQVGGSLQARPSKRKRHAIDITARYVVARNPRRGQSLGRTVQYARLILPLQRSP